LAKEVTRAPQDLFNKTPNLAPLVLTFFFFLVTPSIYNIYLLTTNDT